MRDDGAREMGRRIRRRRIDLGLTQEEAASRAGISPTTWRNLELGRQGARALTLAAVAAVLDTIPADLHRDGVGVSLLEHVADAVERQPTAAALLDTFHAICNELVPQAAIERITFVVRRGDAAESVATSGDESEGPPIGTRLRIQDDAVLRSVLDEGRSAVIDLTRVPARNPVRAALHAAGMRSELAIPLRSAGRVRGLLLMTSRRDRAFDDVDIGPLEAVSRVAVHVLSSLLMFGRSSRTEELPADTQEEAVRLAGALARLDEADRRLVADLIDRLSDRERPTGVSDRRPDRRVG